MNQSEQSLCASVIVLKADDKPGLTAGHFRKPSFSVSKDCFPFSHQTGL